jgi:hypothetical protein
MLALPLPEISAPPVFGQRMSRGLDDPRTSRVVTLFALAGMGAAAAMLWVGSRRAEISDAARVETPAAATAAAWANRASAPAAGAREEAAELSLSRTVLVESQPSGALVKVGGQALGLTPLSTLLPVGTQQLSISKQGYLAEQAFVQLDPAPAGAKAVRTRVILRESAEASPEASPKPRAVAARPARRAAPRRAPVAENPRDDAPAPTAANVEATPEPARPEPSPEPALVEERSRVRLLEDQGRARILE